MEKKDYNKFSTELWDGFDSLSKHTANEIQFCKDILKFFKKKKDIEEEYGKALEKLAKKAEYTNPHGSVAQCWQSILSETANCANFHMNVVSHINEKVVESVQSLIKDMESQRKQLVTEGTALNTELASSLEALRKAKAGYEKACKEAEIAKLTYEKAKSDPQTKQKDLPKLEKESATKQAAAIAKDEAYKKQVEDTNSVMEQYYTDKMPKILNEFEHFETVRIQMVKANMKKYVRILQDLPPCLVKECDSLSQSIERVNHDSDVDLFVSQNKTHQEVPDPFEYEPYQQGNQVAKTKPGEKIKRFIRVKSTMVTRAQLEKEQAAANNPPGLPQATPPPKPKTAVFGVTFQEVMEKQKEKFPESEIPHILEALVDAVFTMDATETPDKSLELLEQMPPLNKKIILYLIQFLRELSTPEVIEATKMSLDNLAMCLAPSFLRCPYQDYNRVLASTDKQKAFVLDLMAKVPSATKPLWRLSDMKKEESIDPVTPPPLPPFPGEDEKKPES